MAKARELALFALEEAEMEAFLRKAVSLLVVNLDHFSSAFASLFTLSWAFESRNSAHNCVCVF
jgi:hypothetical protein